MPGCGSGRLLLPYSNPSIFSASIFLSSSNNFVVVFQLRMVMDLYTGDAMILLSRLLVRCELRRCE